MRLKSIDIHSSKMSSPRSVVGFNLSTRSYSFKFFTAIAVLLIGDIFSNLLILRLPNSALCKKISSRTYLKPYLEIFTGEREYFKQFADEPSHNEEVNHFKNI